MSSVTRRIIRYAIVLAVIAGGVAGGMYLGSAIGLNQDYPEGSVLPVTEAEPATQPLIVAGDLFPPIELASSNPAPTLRDLVLGKRSVVMFVSGGCSRCTELLDYWNRSVAGESGGPVSVILVQSEPGRPLSDDQLALVPGATVVSCDSIQARDQFNIVVQPTIFAVDNQGFVQAVQIDFGGRFTPEMSEYLHQ